MSGGEDHPVLVPSVGVSSGVDGIEVVGVEVMMGSVTVINSVIVVGDNDTVTVVSSSLVIVIVDVESRIEVEGVVIYEKEKGYC